MKRLLVIGGRDPSVVKAASLGAEIVLFQIPGMFSATQAKYCSHAELFDFRNAAESIERAEALHLQNPFDAVVSFWEEGLEIASQVGEQLNVLCNPLASVLATRNKVTMRKLLGQLPVNDVSYRECFSKEDVMEFLPSIQYKGILKPEDGSGSRGVYAFHSGEEAEHAWNYTSKTSAPPMLVEELIEGPEFSVESLSLFGKHEILAITEKETTGPPNFIETGHRMPAKINVELESALKTATIEILERLGHRIGPAHSEFKLCTKRGIPVIIETHTRIGGDQIWEMVEFTTGSDQISETCASLLGLPFERSGAITNAAAIKFFILQPGKIHSIDGIEKANMVNGIIRVDIPIKPGEEVPQLTSSKTRSGYVLAIGEDSYVVQASITDAIGKIRFNIQ